MTSNSKDYMLRSDYTKDKLFVAVVSALRSYNELNKFEDHDHSLERIIESSVSIYQERRFSEFSRDVMRQLRSILCLNNKALEERTSGFTAKKVDGIYVITSCFGDFHKFKKLYMEDMLSKDVVKLVLQAEKSSEKQYKNKEFSVCFEDNHGGSHVIYIRTSQNITEWDENLIDIFCTNISEDFDHLYNQEEEVIGIKEIVFALGEVAEARAKVIGNHVERVSQYSYFLACKLGLDNQEAELIKEATPIHDIGKLLISDRILNKPGRLTIEEFDIVKEHAIVGYNMLKNAKDPVLKMAATIAVTHHEKYNGSGYPYGIEGEAIPISGRIVALAM